MQPDFTLILLSQHYPFYKNLQLLSYNDNLMEDDDVAEFLQTTEQQISKRILDNVYAYASTAV